LTTETCIAACALALLCGCDDHRWGQPIGGFDSVPQYEPTLDGVLDFNDDQCAGCHSESGGTEPIWETAILEDLDSGAGQWIVAGDAEASAFWQAAAGVDGAPIMPPSGTLPSAYTEHIREWIDAGAEVTR